MRCNGLFTAKKAKHKKIFPLKSDIAKKGVTLCCIIELQRKNAYCSIILNIKAQQQFMP